MLVRATAVLLTLAALAGGGTAAYTVRAGDTLSGIAARLGVPLRALADANAITDPDRILAGSRLRVPEGGAEAGASPARRGDVVAQLEGTARRYGWSAGFVKALAWQESGWNQGVRSPAGAVGVMQVMPGTGRFVSRHLVGRSLDLAHSADNIEAGVAFLDYLYRLTGRDPELTLAGYYQGLASVRRNGMYDDTRRYIANVLALRERFR